MKNKLCTTHIITIMLRNQKQNKVIIQAMNNFYKLTKILELITKSTIIHTKLLLLKKRNHMNILTSMLMLKNIIILIIPKLKNQSININKRHKQKKLKKRLKQ
jgi:hypothetical protein